MRRVCVSGRESDRLRSPFRAIPSSGLLGGRRMLYVRLRIRCCRLCLLEGVHELEGDYSLLVSG